jgi:hypothetical protein
MPVESMRGQCHLFVKRCLQLVKNVFEGTADSACRRISWRFCAQVVLHARNLFRIIAAKVLA